MYGQIPDLPLIIQIAYGLAIGWHFSYVFAMVLGTIQEMMGFRKQWKRYDAKVDAAAKKLGEAKDRDTAIQVTEEFIKALTEKQEAEVPRFEDIRMWMWWAEVHVAFPALNFVWAITAHSALDWFLVGVNVLVNYLWWKYHDHDDRWKKKRKRALEKVQEVGGKLVVVPVPAPANG